MSTKQRRLAQLLDHIASIEGRALTLTEWGRAVGLRRTPYLKQLADTLVDYGVVDCYEDSWRVNGLPTNLYAVNIVSPALVTETLVTLEQAAQCSEGEL